MKTIKNIFKSKITYAVLACLLLVGVFAGLTTLASDDPIVTIESKNINHADSARLVYQVKLANVTRDELVANAGKLKMHFWTTEPAAPNATPELTTTEFIFDDTKENAPEAWVLFESYDIAPKAMTNSVYCAVEYNGVYSGVCRYVWRERFVESAFDQRVGERAAEAADCHAAQRSQNQTHGDTSTMMKVKLSGAPHLKTSAERRSFAFATGPEATSAARRVGETTSCTPSEHIT